MILLDTSVLAYATGGEHPLRAPCQRILDLHGSGTIHATTTVEVLQEFLHIGSRRRPRSEVVTLTRAYRDAFDLITTQPTDLDRALELYEQHTDLGPFDAVLAAVALERRAEALVSADRAFAAVPGLRWVDPGSRDLDALLEQRG